MAKTAKLSFSLDYYVPSKLKEHARSDAGYKEIKKEYSRLRDIAQKRLKRLKAAGYTDLDVYQKNYKHYPLLKRIRSKSELAQRLSDLSRFIIAQRSTVSGIKAAQKKALKTFKESGYDFINESNVEEFGQYMEEYRDQLLDYEYDSGEAADAFRVAEKQKVPPEEVQKDFEWWLENKEAVEKLKPTSKDEATLGTIKQRVTKAKKKGKK